MKPDEHDPENATGSRRVWWPGDLYIFGDQPTDPADFWRDICFSDPIPDHPALPAVARVLVDRPRLLTALQYAHQSMPEEPARTMVEDYEAVEALIAALSQGDRDGNRSN